MKVYQLKKTQKMPITLEQAWDFFSTPINLQEITPKYMGFIIKTDLKGVKMYPGQIINYTVTPVLGIPMNWTTEITHVKDFEYFVDEQRFGPYALWHHKHFFKQIEGGVEMTDIVDYAIPFGFLGRIANSIMVKTKLEEIFQYRFKKVEELFGVYKSH
jgi:ligand-binding SRPBCC domain-containing protein